MGSVVLIGIGGFFGALARHVLDKRVTSLLGPAMPWGIFVVNITGCLVVGLVYALIVERGALTVQLRTPLMVGFLGAFTTFSTLLLDSWRLFEEGAIAAAMANLAGSVVLGLTAVWLGLTIGRAF
jgi:CrcB protein